MFWDDWRTHLEALDPDDEGWNGAEAFATAIKELIERRNRLLQDSVWRSLRDLRRDCVEELDYLEICEVETWSESLVPGNSSSECVGLLRDFHDLLLVHREARTTPSKNRTEEDAKRTRLDSISTEVLQLRDRLVSCYFLSREQRPLDSGTEQVPIPSEPCHGSEPEEPPKPRVGASIGARQGTAPPPPGSGRNDPQKRGSRRDSLLIKENPKDVFLEGLRERGIIGADLFEKMKAAPRTRQLDMSILNVDELVDSILEENHDELGQLKAESHGVAENATEGDAGTRTVSQHVNDDAIAAEPQGATAIEAPQPVPEPEATATSSESLHGQSEEQAEALVCSLVDRDDLPGAYWACRSIEARNERPPIPSWLIMAVQIADWHPERDLVLANELLQLTTAQSVPDTESCRLMALAAAALPALLVPESNTAIWLSQDLPYSHLRALIEGVREFTRRGTRLRAEDIGHRQGREKTEARLRDSIQTATHWISNAASHHTKLMRANRIWARLVRPNGELYDLMKAAAEDRRSEIEKVKKAVATWRDRQEIERRISQLDQELNGRKVRPIQSSPKDQLVHWILEACTMLDEWYSAVEAVQRLSSGATWIGDQVQALGRCVQTNLVSAIREVEECSTASSANVRTAAKCAIRFLRQLEVFFEGREENVVPSLQPWQMCAPVSPDAIGRLSTRLWFLPGVPLDNSGRPLPESLSSIIDALSSEQERPHSALRSLEERMSHQDFRFIESMAACLEVDEWTAVNQRYTNLLETSRISLAEHVSQLEVQIENYMADGVITHDNRSDYHGILSSILPAETYDFAPEFAKLDRVRNGMDEHRRNRLASQMLLWSENRDRLLRLASQDERQKITAFLNDSLTTGDTRVVDECISRLEEATHQGDEPRISWFTASGKTRDVLGEFLAAYGDLERGLSRTSDVHNVLLALKSANTLPKPRLEEAARAMYAWRKLRQGSANVANNLRQFIVSVLGFIGLHSVATDSSIESIGSGTDWAHFRAHLSAAGLCPVPQFGSLREDHYDVMAVWERPGTQTLGARINEARLAKQPTIVLYLGRLKLSQRIDLAQYCYREEIQALVIDELLLGFLCGERDARLPVCFSIGLPFTAVNPYAPHSAGNVPPEMFFGRDNMNRAIQDFSGNGSCLVYGGRQLGKSAILRRAQREFHHPELRRFAVYEDIRLIGDALAGQSADRLWIRLRDQLIRLGILAKNITTEQPDRIIGRVLEYLKENTEAQVLLLLDEADSFLEQDARQGFAIVSDLKRIMEESRRRFKVVFAGLHNVQRFQGIPNQPFAHLGAPLHVGPLNPQSARDLVKKPLETMGFQFENESLVLKILSYTNYHPGLIQLFCSRLLDDLHRQAGIEGPPPYRIRATDIQTVYSNRRLEQDIRERFDWTLALDPRYQAIAWSIIEDQVEERDSFARLYRGEEIADLVSQWWPQGFQGLSMEGLRGLLDEMCGLGVLVRAEAGYRLRSPNLVHLMGTGEDIFTRLAELSAKTPTTRVFDADTHRESFGEGRFSPFTYAQSRSLIRPKMGVGLVFGSEASGLTLVPEAASRFLPDDLPDGAKGKFQEVSASVLDGKSLSQWLADFWRSHSEYCRLVVLCRVVADADAKSVILAAQEFCRHRQSSQRQWMRFICVFDPAAASKWFQLDDETRIDIEGRVESVTALSLWAREAIKLRLATEEKIDTEAICEAIVAATGGWSFLLDELFTTCGTEVDPRRAIDDLKTALSQESGVRKRFVASTGVETIPGARELLEVLSRLGEPVDREFLIEVCSEGGLSPAGVMSAAECMLRLGLLTEQGGQVSIQEQVVHVMAQS